METHQLHGGQAWVRNAKSKSEERTEDDDDNGLAPTLECTGCSWYREISDPTEPQEQYCPECGADVVIERETAEPETTKTDKI